MPASWCFESKRSWSKKKMQKERIENWELKREGNRVENANVRLNSFDILHWSVCGNKPTSRVILLILRLSWLLLLLLLWLLGFRANQFACLNRRSSTNNNRTIQTENTIFDRWMKSQKREEWKIRSEKWMEFCGPNWIRSNWIRLFERRWFEEIDMVLS